MRRRLSSAAAFVFVYSVVRCPVCGTRVETRAMVSARDRRTTPGVLPTERGRVGGVTSAEHCALMALARLSQSNSSSVVPGATV